MEIGIAPFAFVLALASVAVLTKVQRGE